MSNKAVRAGSWATVVLGLVATLLAVVGTSGPATASATGGRVGPGTQLVTGGRACTAGFVFRDARGHTFLGYAASCATRKPVRSDRACAARPLRAGTPVRLADRGHTLGYGVLGYSSLRALRKAGVTDAATCAANDFALVQLHGSLARRVGASMPYWGGPVDLGTLPAAGATVFGLARQSSGGRTIPRAGQVSATSGSSAAVTTMLPSTRSDRGSGFLDDHGRAVGILSRSSATGDNVVTSLSAAVDYARTHGVPGLVLVHGGGFSGSAIL
ncbi:MAG TPA: hypothetical protein VHO29_00430 [Marmoricola sp.]|nr:hypothetical protein [Marmoricola sp.]